VSLRRHATGFTLLEAIVAMVLMATSLLALYGWLSTSTISLNRAQAQTHAVEDARSALAVVETINPMSEPQGERELPPLLVRWQSTPVAQRRPGLSRIGMTTQFDFILYQVDVEVLRDGERVRDFSFRKAGWEVVRAINPDDF